MNEASTEFNACLTVTNSYVTENGRSRESKQMSSMTQNDDSISANFCDRTVVHQFIVPNSPNRVEADGHLDSNRTAGIKTEVKNSYLFCHIFADSLHATQKRHKL